jgi:hypothetical protein
MESTTSASVNPENANRSFEIFLDVSDEQTRRIYVAQQKSHTMEGWKTQRRKEEGSIGDRIIVRTTIG